MENTKNCQGKCGFYQSNEYNICKICEKKDPSKRELDVNIKELDINIHKPKKQKKEDKPVQKNTSRCWICKKKIGLIGIQCRCKYYFCGKHRYPEEHKCYIDYKKLDRDVLKKNIVKCQFAKIDKL